MFSHRVGIAWIDSYEEKYGPANNNQLKLLRPPASVPAHHHHHPNSKPFEAQRRVSKDGYVDWDDPRLGPAQDSRAKIPHFLRYGRASMRGRKWDHLRSAEPVIVPGHTSAVASKHVPWDEFVHSSSWGHIPGEDSEIVDHSYLEKLQPTFADDPTGGFSHLHTQTSRRKRTLAPWKRIWILSLRHSLSPLILRLIVMVTSIVALGIAGRMYVLEKGVHQASAERTQSLMAIVVDCVAIPYIGYMIWDEYTGKPLGLRTGVSKMALIMLDLFFIIFKSASTALAFESLVYHNVKEKTVRSLAKALATFMLVALISWTMNFTVNIFRTVERLGGGDDEDRRK